MERYNFAGLSYIRATIEIARILYDSGVNDDMSDARLIAEHVLGMEYGRFITCDEFVTLEQSDDIYEIIEQRREGNPLQYILGSAWFMGLEFIVKPGVLIPRRDSEVLAAKAINTAPRRGSVLDMCCGSGCLGISLAKVRPDITLTLADIGDTPCSVTRENCLRHGVDATVIQSDLFHALSGQIFDMIICNPPYIPAADIDSLSTEVSREPRLALDGGGDGLDFYRRLIPQAAEHLRPEGILAMEFGFGQSDDIAKILDNCRYTSHDILFDMESRPRAVFARWR